VTDIGETELVAKDTVNRNSKTKKLKYPAILGDIADGGKFS
jgi:hypothetical protein